ncbi:MAG: helix-turn-helix domain-containing protein [Oscillospiraceae bacterium]|nr:helix-turn-helix domain-containing protein [Oscillospiraceae bacterium]
MNNSRPESTVAFSSEQLKDIERTFLDPDYLILLANALKAERAARIKAETHLNQMLSSDNCVEQIAENKDTLRTKNVLVNNCSTFISKNEKPALSVKQAAMKLNVSEKTIRRRIDDGTLRAKKLSPRCVRIDPKDLDAFIEESAT